MDDGAHENEVQGQAEEAAQGEAQAAEAASEEQAAEQPKEAVKGKKGKKAAVAEEAAPTAPDPIVRVSVTLVFEAKRAGFANVAGDIRDVLISSARNEWKDAIGNITKDQAQFEGC